MSSPHRRSLLTWSFREKQRRRLHRWHRVLSSQSQHEFCCVFPRPSSCFQSRIAHRSADKSFQTGTGKEDLQREKQTDVIRAAKRNKVTLVLVCTVMFRTLRRLDCLPHANGHDRERSNHGLLSEGSKTHASGPCCIVPSMAIGGFVVPRGGTVLLHSIIIIVVVVVVSGCSRRCCHKLVEMATRELSTHLYTGRRLLQSPAHQCPHL